MGTFTINTQASIPIIHNFDVTGDWNLTKDSSGNIASVTNVVTFTQWVTNGLQNNLTGVSVLNFDLTNGRLKCNLTATGGTNFNMRELAITVVEKLQLASSITFLDLRHNQLTTFNPTLPLPSSLTALLLNYNQLTTFNPTLPLPSSLTTLQVRYNQLTTFNPTLPLPSSLNYIELGNNLLTTFNPTLPLPSTMAFLALSNNQLTTFNPTLPLPSSLTTLQLTSNQLTTFNPTLSLPSSLTTLELDYNQLTNVSYTTSEAWANAQPSFTSSCSISFLGNPDSIIGTNLKTILLTKNCFII